MFTVESASHPFSVDLPHAVLLAGVVLSLKPQSVFELGIGPGYTTEVILDALAHNGRGLLTCVDDWYDNGGNEPPHIRHIVERGARVVVSHEEDYVKSCPTHSYDIVVSDADHRNTNRWLDHQLRITRPGGFSFLP